MEPLRIYKSYLTPSRVKGEAPFEKALTYSCQPASTLAIVKIGSEIRKKKKEKEKYHANVARTLPLDHPPLCFQSGRLALRDRNDESSRRHDAAIGLIRRETRRVRARDLIRAAAERGGWF